MEKMEFKMYCKYKHMQIWCKLSWFKNSSKHMQVVSCFVHLVA
jgi:hypothetical protein